MAPAGILALAGLLVVGGSAYGERVEIPTPSCPNASNVTIRYAQSTARLYLEAETGEPGCVTLTSIFESRAGKGPLYAIDSETGWISENVTGTWLLTESLYIEDGNVLNVHGGPDGDCDELRLLSNNETFINLRAYGGGLSFMDTKVFSWDDYAGTYDMDLDDGRSYISALSEVIYEPTLNCSGMAKNEMGEGRMDIIRSEMGYLGYKESESWGLTWKVRGFCKDKRNPEVFDFVDVYGNIIDSDIHHNYFGMYTYGHQQGNWSYNKMHDNVQYGFDPHDDSDYLTIHDNEVWGNGNHGIIASKRCNNVSIQNNHVYGGDNAGIFLHRSSDGAIVKNNIVHDNGDAGLALLEAFDLDVSENEFYNNKYGIRLSVGSARNHFYNNLLSNSSSYHIFTYLGSDKPDVPGTSGYMLDNAFYNNIMSLTASDAIKLKEAERTLITGNTFEDVTDLRFVNCTDTAIYGNTGDEALEELNVVDSCFAESSDEQYVPLC